MRWSSPPLPPGVIPPPLSYPKAQYFKTHPEAWAAFVSHLPRPSSTASEQSRSADKAGASPWQTVTNAPGSGLCNALLLTDGTVMVHSCGTPTYYKLTPDSAGNYADGTWSTLASLPVMGGTQYAPQYNASAVLPDGRVIVEGGEYNNGQAVWTNLGAIYDPVANTWTAVTGPTGWSQIGDAESVVLANGSFMLGGCCNQPAADAIFNPTKLTWTSTGAPTAGDNYQDEQGYELLPNGNVLTVDIWTNANNGGNAPTNAEQYSPKTAAWSSAGNTPVSLVDPYACGNYEIGPAVTRGDGTVVGFGGNSGCQAPTADPTAVFNVKTSTWTAGPYVPAICGSGGTTSCSLPDSPAALEPDGAILFAASSSFGGFPTHFFEFSAQNTIAQVADTLEHNANSGAYYYNFLVLPNGQILSTDFSKNAEVYTPAGPPVTAWAPIIKKVPAKLAVGKTYTVTGVQLSGVTQGAYYGDDEQAATNYPIVKIVNTASGNVTYARSFNFASMSIEPMSKDNSAQFVLPVGVAKGASSLYVVANGIASTPVSVTIK